MLKCVGPVDLPARAFVGLQPLLGGVADGLADVVQQNLGLNFLSDGFRQLATEAFQVLALFDQLEAFFYAPSAMESWPKLSAGQRSVSSSEVTSTSIRPLGNTN
ncbi:MAG: hypothetical protein ACK5NY_02985 [Burkholderiaceae bacterium]